MTAFAGKSAVVHWHEHEVGWAGISIIDGLQYVSRVLQLAMTQ
ncbi:hypothetical protein ACVINZ_000061 [Mesorhizobium jarvisii]